MPRTGWALAVLILVVLFGVRNLLASRLPLVGQLLPFPAPAVLLREFFNGWRDAGWQATGPAPPAFGLVGVAGAVLFGSTAQVAWAVEAAIDALGGDPGDLKHIKVRFSRPVKIDDIVTFTATRTDKRVEIKAVDQEGNDTLKNTVAEGR